ncbi:transposase [Streptomyces sp. JH14]|uniref:transposase n=1 Tax=Streptomyces sp. JH14 TaxID=2793630 RepID=UPI0023F6FCB1|nr:transposase [Streptomyces sp. JH14]MDF6041010.1 transposase [Streptomyces sp. JH14]
MKLVLEGALEAEPTEHPGYEKGDKAAAGSGNSRNRTSKRRVLTDVGSPQVVPNSGSTGRRNTGP